MSKCLNRSHLGTVDDAVIKDLYTLLATRPSNLEHGLKAVVQNVHKMTGTEAVTSVDEVRMKQLSFTIKALKKAVVDDKGEVRRGVVRGVGGLRHSRITFSSCCRPGFLFHVTDDPLLANSEQVQYDKFKNYFVKTGLTIDLNKKELK